MGKTDTIFLFCVLSCAGLFALRSIAQSVPLLSVEAASGSAAFGAAGQSHNVDMQELKRLLEQGALSDHEAEFYGPVGTSLESSGRENGESEPDVSHRHESHPDAEGMGYGAGP